MIVLGIESSCDETSVAILKDGKDVLANVTATSLNKHKEFGGVVPEIAARHSLEYIDKVYTRALDEARVKPDDISLIAVTYGPGLMGSLIVGVSFAKALSVALNKPVMPVNHLQAHIFVNFIDNPMPEGRYMGLAVSGGHTSLVIVDGINFREIASTRDDACGEAFDKVAKILGLGYPGGPVIEREAEKSKRRDLKFKCGQFKGSFDFSFSGIKTGVLYYVNKRANFEDEIPDIAYAFQESVVKDIVKKSVKAALKYGVKLISVGGGVSANKYFRNMLVEKCGEEGIEVLFPKFEYSLDNGIMVAKAGDILYSYGVKCRTGFSPVPALGWRR